MMLLIRMRTRISILIILLFQLINTAWAEQAEQSDTPTLWSQSGDWTIYVSNPENGGCYMERRFEKGTIIRLGLETISHEGYFVVLNEEWTNIENAQAGEIYFDFGNEVFGGDAVGLVEGEFRGGIARFNNPDLVTALANRLTVVVSGAAGVGFEFTLRGTKVGIAETDRCRVAQRSH